MVYVWSALWIPSSLWHIADTVSQELTPADKALLEEEGVCLPSHRQRKRKQQSPADEHVCTDSGTSAKNSHSEQRWEDVKQYLDPNPQLKGIEKGKYATKVRWERIGRVIDDI